MKTMDIKRKQQQGFFDLGLGLGLMLVFGGTAASLDTDKAEQEMLAKPQTEIAKPEMVVVQSEQD